ncbi:amino acid transporter [Mycolicibacterium sp. BK634]|uniref:APC family permease n=1 Tax=Mycolicibacterium sp. BK634 TaxID=2587099 RepID=UPI00104E6A37|nr:APC family permease [Mycolicibacterium sp. BK634]MBB3753566.1 amino acid transporter [Mycolicibacterium sp. BK634]
MSNPSDTSPPAPSIRTERLTGELTTGSIVFMVVAAAAPLTIIGGVTPIGFVLGNGVGFPALYIVGAVILLFFAVGLSTMSRYIPQPGAFFTYVGHGLSGSWGLGAAFLAILTYAGVQIAVFAYIGATATTAAESLGLPTLPWWAWTLAAVLLVGLLGYRRIGLSSKVLGILLIAEVAIVVALDVAVIARGGADGLSLAPFSPAVIRSGNLGVGLMFAIAGFVGFESTAVFRDEAKDPVRSIPRATYIAVAAIGAFYAVSAWALVMAWGPTRIVDVASGNPEALMLNTTSKYLGSAAGIGVQALLVTSLFACVLSFHNVVTRYLHTLGSAGVLPRAVGRRHPGHGSPHTASVVQTGAVMAVLLALVASGLDPVLQIFTWLSGTTTLGVIVLMALTCLAVLVYFARTSIDGRIWQTKLAPALGLIGLVAILAIVVVNYPTLVGGSVVVAVVIEAVLLATVLGGFALALLLRSRRPDVYAGLTEAIAV